MNRAHPRFRLGGLALPAALSALALCRAPAAEAATYALGDGQAVVGEVRTVTTARRDTLYDLARRFDASAEELIRANPGVDPRRPGADRTIVVPLQHVLPDTPHEGLVVNLPEHRVYYYPAPKPGQPPQVRTYPVSIGKRDWRTPLGLTSVIEKRRNPAWFPPKAIREERARAGSPLPVEVPPGPDNPLGRFAMRLAVGDGSYEIHGTNNPAAIGMPVTHGCIRMYPEDIAELFSLVPVGTPVRLVNEPLKVAWVGRELRLEAHPPIDEQGQGLEPDLEEFSQLLRATVDGRSVAIDWASARDVMQKADGLIVTVGVAGDPPD